ncbi:MAG: hypothetical protein GY810_14425 [Aureispira sp.]|nr:hypothetical protein [Aureispira sp.]
MKKAIKWKELAPTTLVFVALLALIFWWVNRSLKTDGQEVDALFKKVATVYPSLSVEIHESETYFPCIIGNIRGTNVHFHHGYKGRGGNRKDYLYAEFWTDQTINTARWFSLTESGFTISDSQKGLKQDILHQGLQELYTLKDRDTSFAQPIFTGQLAETLLNLNAKGGFGEIFLNEGNLKFMRIPYPQNPSEEDVLQLRNILELGVALQAQILVRDQGAL